MQNSQMYVFLIVRNFLIIRNFMFQKSTFFRNKILYRRDGIKKYESECIHSIKPKEMKESYDEIHYYTL